MICIKHDGIFLTTLTATMTLIVSSCVSSLLSVNIAKDFKLGIMKQDMCFTMMACDQY